MKIERKDLWRSVVELIIEVDASNVKKHRAKAISYLQKNAEIKGFRKWHVTEAILLKHYGEEYISQVTVDFAIDEVYREALKQEKLLPVSQWEIKEIISQIPMKIRMEVEVFPTIEIEDSYKNISLKKKSVEVSDAEIQDAIEDIERRFTTFVEASEWEVSAFWDRVTIDTQGYDLEWNELAHTDMKNYPLTLGSAILVPWFEDKMIWAKVWDELNLDISFPTDYHNENFAGKQTKFIVKINKLEKAKKPEFTPEFIESLRWKKLDLEWFKALIKTELLDVKESNTRIDEERELIDELLKITKLDLGEKILAEQIKRVFEEIKQNMLKDWIKMSDYLESLRMSEEEYKEKNVKPVATRRLQWELILNKLSELEPEKAKVSDEEMKSEIEKIKANFQNEEVLRRLEELYREGNNYYAELKARIWFRNLINSFFA